MLNIWTAIFTSVGAIILFNNFLIINMKGIIQNKLLENHSIMNNPLVWNGYKIYAVSKNNISLYLGKFKKYIHKNSLKSNILLITNGVRTHNITCRNNSTKISYIDVVEHENTKADLILYRSPASNNDYDYDIIRLNDLDNISFSEKEILLHANPEDDVSADDAIIDSGAINSTNQCNSHDNCAVGNCKTSLININYSPSTHKIYSPTLKFDNSEDTYDLTLAKDNFYVTGNKLFDSQFIAWILKEKYNILLEPNIPYSISFFNENMELKTLRRGEDVVLCSEEINFNLINDKTENSDTGTSWW